MIKRALRLAGLLKRPLAKTALAATGLVLNLDKAAIIDKTARGWPALIKLPSADKRPLRLAGLDKVAILPALDKNGSAWPLINSLYGTI